MAIETWLAFAVASALLLAMPGPTVLLVVSHALGNGWRAAVPTVIGVTLGDFLAMTVSMAGLGAILIASGELYTALRWLGAAYLVYLGIRLWRAPVEASDVSTAKALSGWSMCRNALAVTLLNPKTLVFFIAFVPQFLDPKGDVFVQSTLMIITFTMLGAINTAIYAYVAVRAREMIRRPSVQKIVNRISGSLLIGAGAMTAASSRA